MPPPGTSDSGARLETGTWKPSNRSDGREGLDLMGGAFGWGLFAGSSLILGGAIALLFPIRERLLGLIMAFGAGVLISAVAFELVLEAYETAAGSGRVALGLAAGALTFFVGDLLVDRLGGEGRKQISGSAQTGPGLAIVLGIVLDGIPESAVIGLGLLEGNGVSVAVIAAVFLSNLPEAIAATSGLRSGGWKPGRIIGLWAAVALVCGLASLLGYAVFDSAGPEAFGLVLGFAGGAILTMLADTMMPEAFKHGGKLVGLATTLGFALAFALTMLD
jgi:zinc transporter, ZIP family